MTEVEKFFARSGVKWSWRELSQREVNMLVLQLVFEHCGGEIPPEDKPMFDYGPDCYGMGV